MATAAKPKVGRPRVGTTRTTGGRTRATRWHPGITQAAELNAAGKRLGKSRAALLRDVIAPWGLKRSVVEVREQAEVPPATPEQPLAERQVSWAPQDGQLDALDAQAERVSAPKDVEDVGRNELLRRHVAAWLQTQE